MLILISLPETQQQWSQSAGGDVMCYTTGEVGQLMSVSCLQSLKHAQGERGREKPTQLPASSTTKQGQTALCRCSVRANTSISMLLHKEDTDKENIINTVHTVYAITNKYNEINISRKIYTFTNIVKPKFPISLKLNIKCK